MAGINILFLVVLLCCMPSCFATTLYLNFFQNATDRGAICNDGTPSGYYFAPGFGSGINTWVIHQEGGWWCWDEDTCAWRAQTSPYLISSTSWPSNVSIEGIFDEDPTNNPTFYNANKVFIGYCTSDAWSGTKLANGTTGLDAWSFMGLAVVRAAIEDLVEIGMNSSATQILWTGCSAGGNGVLVNVDYARSLLPFTPNKFLAFSDAGWVANVHGTYASFFEQYEQGYTTWQGQMNQVCMQANPATPFLCYMGSVTLGYLQTPVLIHVEQYDVVQFEIDCSCVFNASSTSQMEGLATLRSTISASVTTIKPPHSVFSPACVYHCTTLDNTFSTITVQGITLAQQLAKFWVGATPSVVDNCSGLACSQNCPAY